MKLACYASQVAVDIVAASIDYTCISHVLTMAMRSGDPLMFPAYFLSTMLFPFPLLPRALLKKLHKNTFKLVRLLPERRML